MRLPVGLYWQLWDSVVDGDFRYSYAPAQALALALFHPAKMLSKQVEVDLEPDALLHLRDELEYRSDVWRDWGREGAGYLRSAKRLIPEIDEILEVLTTPQGVAA